MGVCWFPGPHWKDVGFSATPRDLRSFHGKVSVLDLTLPLEYGQICSPLGTYFTLFYNKGPPGSAGQRDKRVQDEEPKRHDESLPGRYLGTYLDMGVTTFAPAGL